MRDVLHRNRHNHSNILWWRCLFTRQSDTRANFSFTVRGRLWHIVFRTTPKWRAPARQFCICKSLIIEHPIAVGSTTCRTRTLIFLAAMIAYFMKFATDRISPTVLSGSPEGAIVAVLVIAPIVAFVERTI